MTEYQLKSIVSLLEDFLHSGSVVLGHLKSQSKINNNNKKKIKDIGREEGGRGRGANSLKKTLSLFTLTPDSFKVHGGVPFDI